MRHVVLSGPQAVYAGVPFEVDIAIHATPGASATPSLRQTNPIAKGTWTTQTPVAIGPTGIGYGKFEAVIASAKPLTTFTGDVPDDQTVMIDTLSVKVI